MPADFDQRAASLAVSRYGADRARVSQAAQALAQENAAGASGSLIDRLVSENVLTTEQAQALRIELTSTAVDLTSRPARGFGDEDPGTTDLSPVKPWSLGPLPTQSGHFLRQLGGYRLLRRLGEGGMGTVFLGFNEAEKDYVAIKVLADALSKNEYYVARFLREAKNGCRLHHPNVVRTISAGQEPQSGKQFLVMEFVDGPSARMLLANFGRLAVGDAVHIVLDIARALDYVHARKFVHRDIKPDNILLTHSGIAKLADLGLAKCIGDDVTLTGRHKAFGTPYYMPCEQALDAKLVDGRSDIYALGASFYHLVTGQVPFPGNTHMQIAERKLTGKYLPASQVNPAVPAILDRILDRMLAKEPQDRYQTAGDLIVDLQDTRLDVSQLSFLKPDSGAGAETPGTEFSGQATIIDAAGDGPAPRPPAAVVGDVWFVRYRDGNGQACKLRATTAEIQQRLQARQLPPSAEVSRDIQGDYQVIGRVAAFRDLAVPTVPTPQLNPIFINSRILPTTAPESPTNWWLRVGSWGLGLTLMAVGSGVLLFYLISHK